MTPKTSFGLPVIVRSEAPRRGPVPRNRRERRAMVAGRRREAKAEAEAEATVTVVVDPDAFFSIDPAEFFASPESIARFA